MVLLVYKHCRIHYFIFFKNYGNLLHNYFIFRSNLLHNHFIYEVWMAMMENCGHCVYSCSIFQLGQQQQLEELANSILIEISRSAVPKWQEKLRIRYGWFKTDNCNHIIFDVSQYL